MNDKAKQYFREQGMLGHKARLKKYGKKGVSLLNKKAILSRFMKEKLSTI